MTPLLPDLHPGIRPQSLNSSYHILTARAGCSPFDAIARFSPAGPPSSELSLYDREWRRLLASLKNLYVLAANLSFHTSGGAPCKQRAMFVS